MEQRADNDTDQLWASLSKAIETETPPDLILDGVEMEQRYLLSDRLAASYLSGFWPLAFFCILILAVSGQWSDPIVRIAGVLLTLLVAFLCRPLVRSEFGGCNLLYIFGIAPFLILLTPLIQLLPASAMYHLTAQPHDRYYKPLDFFLAETLQRQIESICQPISLLTLVLGLAFLCASLVWIRSQFPWLEHPPGRPLGKIVAVAVLISPLLLAALATLPNPRVEKWSAQVETPYRNLPVGHLERNLGIRFWQDLESRFGRENELPTFSPESKVEKESLETFRAFETEILEALQNRKPASFEEATACLLAMDDLASRSYLLARPVEVALALEGEQFHGIRYHYSNYIWRYGVIPWLQAPERTLEELDSTSEKLSQLQQNALPYLLDYDFTVYSVWIGDRNLPQPPHAVFRSVHSKRASYLSTHHAAQEMRVLGVRIEPSPTEILVRRSRLQFVEQWLDMRPKFISGLEQTEKLALAEKEDNPESLADYYQGWIINHVLSLEDRDIRETPGVYSRLLAHRARRGSLPSDLRVAGIEDSKRWRLESERGVTVLVDQKLEKYLPISPWSFE